MVKSHPSQHFGGRCLSRESLWTCQCPSHLPAAQRGLVCHGTAPNAFSVPSASPGHYRLPFLRYSQLHAASALRPVPLMPFWWPKTLEKSGRLPGCCCTAALPGCQRAAGMGDGRAVPLVLAQVYIFRCRFIFSACFYFLPSLLSLPQRGWDPHSPRVSCSRRCSCPRAVASAEFIMLIFLLLGWYLLLGW